MCKLNKIMSREHFHDDVWEEKGTSIYKSMSVYTPHCHTICNKLIQPCSQSNTYMYCSYPFQLNVYYRQLRAKRALMLFKDVLLRTRRALSLYILYGDSGLLNLNGTSLNSVNALLVLSVNALLALSRKYILLSPLSQEMTHVLVLKWFIHFSSRLNLLVVTPKMSNFIFFVCD